ncbi:protein of unknown function [Streptomyces sp. KY75]|nr:protein of unknown function [Streptomyces sp. KY75]CAD5994636.1 protein of unknown function [Streptomyces sp. KY70]
MWLRERSDSEPWEARDEAEICAGLSVLQQAQKAQLLRSGPKGFRAGLSIVPACGARRWRR